MTAALLLDAAVFVYATGGEHPLRAPCRSVLRSERDLFASVEAIQEFAHHRLRRTGDRARAAREGTAAAGSCSLLDFTAGVLRRSLTLLQDHPTVRGRDAVHAATALEYGVSTIVSPDAAFDDIPGLTRLNPLDYR